METTFFVAHQYTSDFATEPLSGFVTHSVVLPVRQFVLTDTITSILDPDTQLTLCIVMDESFTPKETSSAPIPLSKFVPVILSVLSLELRPN